MPDAGQRRRRGAGRWPAAASRSRCRSPETTHEFEPMPSPDVAEQRARPPRSTPSTSCHSIDAVDDCRRRRLGRARSRGCDRGDRRARSPGCGRTGTPGRAPSIWSEREIGRDHARARSRPRCWCGGPRPSPSATPPSRRASRARSRSRRFCSAEHGVLERRVGAVVVGEVGVDPVGVGLVVATRSSGSSSVDLLRRRPRASPGCAGTCRSPAATAPNSSESRPPVTCRRKSISQNRSCACTYPCAKNRSSVSRGRDRRDAELVALHRDLATETLDRHGALELRERPLDRPHHEAGGDERDHGRHRRRC